ncbi:hypothetical protein Ae201684P_020457 [Aphanomyces euteiches]|uniref:RxLR effector protein n=1 Tax=Aphanomyces euteiches TaxID=100861 RepID=A0A6G0WEL6_9STRA|nr:hypothetical protein Ae201684_016611 [Aphanomyces euteiches]KAH9084205.1 hypothetical protein Ae201684P_020457 [Aphanomyces euteiches]
MRVLIPLALAISTVVAFNQRRQDSSDSVIQENRFLQQDASFASRSVPKRRLVGNSLLSCFGVCGKSSKQSGRPSDSHSGRPDKTEFFPNSSAVKAKLQKEAKEHANRPVRPKPHIEYPKVMGSESQLRADYTGVHTFAPGANERIAKERQSRAFSSQSTSRGRRS